MLSVTQNEIIKPLLFPGKVKEIVKGETKHFPKTGARMSMFQLILKGHTQHLHRHKIHSKFLFVNTVYSTKPGLIYKLSISLLVLFRLKIVLAMHKKLTSDVI